MTALMSELDQGDILLVHATETDAKVRIISSDLKESHYFVLNIYFI